MLPIHFFVAFAMTGGFCAACLADARHFRKHAVLAYLQFFFWWVLTYNKFGDVVDAQVIGYQEVPLWYQFGIRWLLPLCVVALFSTAVKLRQSRAACLWLLAGGCFAALDWYYLAFEIPFELQTLRQVFLFSDLQNFRLLNGIVFGVVAVVLLAYSVLTELAAARRERVADELAREVHEMTGGQLPAGHEPPASAN